MLDKALRIDLAPPIMTAIHRNRYIRFGTEEVRCRQGNEERIHHSAESASSDPETREALEVVIKGVGRLGRGQVRDVGECELMPGQCRLFTCSFSVNSDQGASRYQMNLFRDHSVRSVQVFSTERPDEQYVDIYCTDSRITSRAEEGLAEFLKLKK